LLRNCTIHLGVTLFSFVLMLCLVSPLAALEVPRLEGRVNDTAQMLSAQTKADLESLLKDFEATDSTQLVVLTIPALDGEILEEYSLKVSEAWQIGQKGVDNGALLLVARDDRKIRIEVGYGLEGSLTDLVAGRIIAGVIVPRFKESNFSQGISDGVMAMVQAVRGEYVASAETSKGNSDNDPAGLIFILIFAFSFIGRALHKKKTLAAVAGGIASPILGLMFFAQLGFWLLALIPVGALGGFFVSSLSATGGGADSMQEAVVLAIHREVLVVDLVVAAAGLAAAVPREGGNEKDSSHVAAFFQC